MSNRGRKAGTPLTQAEVQQRRDASKKSTGPKTEKGKKVASMNGKNHKGRSKGYMLTSKEIKQRRDASKKSTGPKTEKGKDTSSRNNFKHGLYVKNFRTEIRKKPCFSSCEKFNSCFHIQHEKTRPGGKCLDMDDWELTEDSIMAVYDAINTGDMTNLNESVAGLEGGLVGYCHMILRKLHAQGPLVKKSIYDKTGNIIGEEYIENPLFDMLIKGLSKLGIGLPEFLATPMARKKVATETAETETAAAITRRLMDRLGPLSGNQQPIDAEVVK